MFISCPKDSPLSLTQAWESLEEAEYQRELALRNELIRQEKLEQLARRFDRKAAMRETWLSENQRLVAQVMGDTLGDGRRGEAFKSPQQSAGLESELASQCRWISLSIGLASLLPGIKWIKIHV